MASSNDNEPEVEIPPEVYEVRDMLPSYLASAPFCDIPVWTLDSVSSVQEFGDELVTRSGAFGTDEYPWSFLPTRSIIRLGDSVILGR